MDDDYLNRQSASNSIRSYSKSSLLSSYLAYDDETTSFDENENQETERLEVLVSLSTLTPVQQQQSHYELIRQNNIDQFSLKNHCFNSEDHHQNDSVSIWNDNTIESSTPRRSHYKIVFEIIKARTVTVYEKSPRNNFEKRKYVNYTILMKRVPGLETSPAVIERRYSEFLNFYNLIKKKYPYLFTDIIFPKKIFIGNFSTEVITERSLAFQTFLNYCLSLPEVRSTKEFASFLFHSELREAKKCLEQIRLEEAASIFENVHFMQEKLLIQTGHPNNQSIHTLCCLIGCLNAIDNIAEASKLANKTFEMLLKTPIVIDSHKNGQVQIVNYLYESNDLVFPLILLTLKQRWLKGYKKNIIERKLEELCQKRSLPRDFDSNATLMEIMLKKNFSTIVN